jgi:hypothetical protein
MLWFPAPSASPFDNRPGAIPAYIPELGREQHRFLAALHSTPTWKSAWMRLEPTTEQHQVYLNFEE